MKKYKIGFVDEDELQVDQYERKLRDYFDVSGYDIHQGLTLDELIDQIYASDIDLLMVDYNMVDSGIITFNGDEVVRKYETIKPRFPMIIFTNWEKAAFPQVDNPNTLYQKGLADEELNKFIVILQKNIEIYQNYITTKKETIDTLQQKASKAGLNGREKHLLTQAQIDLLSLDTRAYEVPVNLLVNDDKIDDLEKITREAEAFLASLNKEDNNDLTAQE